MLSLETESDQISSREEIPPKSLKIAVCGPPHSGKSVYLQGLTANLPRDHYYLFRACPDGEGSWTHISPATQQLRRKGNFNQENTEWYCDHLRNMKIAPLVLVDMGGRMSAENGRIMEEGKIDGAILLSGDKSLLKSWENFCNKHNVPVLKKIYSDYHAPHDKIESDPMVVHRLQRGEDVSHRPAIQQVACELLELKQVKPITNHQEKGGGFSLEGFNGNTLSINGLAQEMGKDPVERTLPNGRVVNQIVWKGEDLPKLANMLHSKSGEMPDPVNIDGAAPAWMVSGLTHMCHPRSVAVNSPDGFIPIGCKRPEGEGYGPNLEFSSEDRNGWKLITCQQKDPSIPLDPDDLDKTAPPEVDPSLKDKVILNGRMPNWLAASLTMSYHGKAQAVALNQPGTGATVAWTHSKNVKLGDVIDTEKPVAENNQTESADNANDLLQKMNNKIEQAPNVHHESKQSNNNVKL